jgi:hypothetical protein
MKNLNDISVYGLGGDALMAPEHTETAFWAALGGGAQGIVTGVRLSKDGVVVCTDYDTFQPTCGDPRAVGALNWNEICQLDAGVMFRSSVLDKSNQPTRTIGLDHPWQGNLPKKQALRMLRLDRVLVLFARRCTVSVLLPSDGQELIEATVALLLKYGVANRVRLFGNQAVCEYLEKKYPDTQRALIGLKATNPSEQIHLAERMKASYLRMDWDDACYPVGDKFLFDEQLKLELAKSKVSLILHSESMVFAPRPPYFEAIKGIHGIDGIVAKGVLPVVQSLTPPALMAMDDFAGTALDKNLWAAGYSHINQDTTISQNDGLHIQIIDGGSYSGAAAVCLLPIHGRFDAQVDFHVANPFQGTTFEMAAICIDPGYHHPDHSDLNTRNVNLTFDVHGAAPYASSERDEDDGFRCGWNNGFNLTKIDSDWQASSANMYNKYGRDVGNGDADNPVGTLRLIRNGSVFVTYYKDRYNIGWVCSGVMLVQNMSDDVFLRLAAKHWNKDGKVPPANDVWFYQFRLFQF